MSHLPYVQAPLSTFPKHVFSKPVPCIHQCFRQHSCYRISSIDHNVFHFPQRLFSLSDERLLSYTDPSSVGDSYPDCCKPPDGYKTDSHSGHKSPALSLSAYTYWQRVRPNLKY